MQEGELDKCKLAEPGHYVCTHQRTLLSTVATDSWAMALLHKRDKLPPVCDTRLIRLSNTVWTQLFNNSWIFYAPQPDIITVLCYDQRPVDVNPKGIGKLRLYPGCKGYSIHTLLYGISVAGNTSVQVAEDFVSQIDLNHVCCEELNAKVNLCQTPVNIACKKTTAHLEDLRSASTKVSDLIKSVDEKQWKNHHVTYRNILSVLLILILCVVSIYFLFKLYTFTFRWKLSGFRKQEASTAPNEVPSATELENQESTASNSNMHSESSSRERKPTPPSPHRVLHPRVANSHF